MSSYPITDRLKSDLPSNLHAHPAVAAIIEAVGEYEHGTADVGDVHADLTLEQYAAVAEDLALTIVNSGDGDPDGIPQPPKVKSPRAATISYETWNQDQSWHYERVIKLGDHKLKVYGRHNAYRNQSYISIQRWAGDAWQHMRTISGAQMATWKATYGPGGPESAYTTRIMRDEMLTAFGEDEIKLVKFAKQILL